MKRLTTTLTVLSLGALLMTPAFAQERRGAGKVPPALLEQFDKDGDGKLNTAEAAAARKALGERRVGGKSGDGKADERERTATRRALEKRRRSAAGSRGGERGGKGAVRRGPVRSGKGAVRRGPVRSGKGAVRPGPVRSGKGATRRGSRNAGGRGRS